jgi:hypothetical protein
LTAVAKLGGYLARGKERECVVNFVGLRHRFKLPVHPDYRLRFTNIVDLNEDNRKFCG